MKTIGMIGGMSWESSKIYYELVNSRVKELLGGVHSCKSIMLSVDFADIEQLTFSDKWEEMGEMMADCARKLQNAGADMIVLCTNTIHLVSEAIEQAVGVPFLHIADATGQAITAQGLKKVLLLGTQFTMEKDFYTKILQERYQLEVIIPSLSDRERLQGMIYNELVKGEFSDQAKADCLRMINKAKALGAEGVILGCTELPILLKDRDLGMPGFDTAQVHAWQAVDLALKAESVAID